VRPPYIVDIRYNLSNLKCAEAQMIKVSVFYPNGPDIHFDMAYYISHHMKMVQELVGPALRGVAVEQGIPGSQPCSRPPTLRWGI
jgi:hypothetical protein